MLRAATADLHSAIDARFSGPFEAERGAYVVFLTALARAVIPLEAALEASGVVRLLPDWPDRRRSAVLRQDLEALGVPLPAPEEAPEATSEASLFGMLYVLEGSRLGGRLLLRRVQGNPDPDVRSATRYLSHGVGLDLWHSFVERLERSEAVAAAQPEAAAAARAAFNMFGATATHA